MVTKLIILNNNNSNSTKYNLKKKILALTSREGIWYSFDDLYDLLKIYYGFIIWYF